MWHITLIEIIVFYVQVFIVYSALLTRVSRPENSLVAKYVQVVGGGLRNILFKDYGAWLTRDGDYTSEYGIL